MIAPDLTTARLRLRAYTEAERAAFVGLFTDPLLMAHVDGPLSAPQADALFSELLGLAPLRASVHTTWAASQDGVYVAHAALLNETEGTGIAYVIAAGYHGQGLATEIATVLIDHGHRTLGLQRLIATVDEDNRASLRVLQKAGMTPLRRDEDADGAWWVYVSSR